MRTLILTLAASLLASVLVASLLNAAEPGAAAGHYSLHGEREVGSELSLHPDGKFDYLLAYGAADYTAQGTWRQEGALVILTTAGKAEPPFRLLRSEAGKEPGMRVKIVAPNGRGIPNIDVEVSGQKARTASDGVAEFGPGVTGPLKILIPVYRLEAGPYALKAGTTEHTFEINGPAITTVRFDAERVALVDGELLLRFWNPEHPMRYRRDERARP